MYSHPCEEKLFKTKVAIFVKCRYSDETVQKPHEQKLHLQLSSLSHFASTNPSRCRFPLCGPNSYPGPTAVILLKSIGVLTGFSRAECDLPLTSWVGESVTASCHAQ